MKKYMKAAAGVLGVAATVLAVSTDVLPENFRPYAAGIVAVATALGIYHTPYAPSVKKTKEV